MVEKARIGLREVRALGLNSEVWDTAVAGFGARRQKGDAVSYILMYRTAAGRQRRFTIGRHGGKWTPDTARNEAKRLLGLVASGSDPAGEKTKARVATTVADLCEAYMDDAEAGRLLTQRRVPKKASTLLIDRMRINSHIKPLLGPRDLSTVTRQHVEAFMHAVAEGKTVLAPANRGKSRTQGGKGAASRTVGLLGAIFTYAVRRELRQDNPVRGVMRYADGRRDRRLSEDEYGKLGVALLDRDRKFWPPALAAMRLIALTGWRRGEVLNLLWSEVDLERRVAVLNDTKIGRSVRPMSAAACTVVNTQARSGTLVFPAPRGDMVMTSFVNTSTRIMDTAGLPNGVTPHVLRHSFASLASDLGYSEPTIGALIGHKSGSMTGRYIHSADEVLLAAADRVAGRIDALLGMPNE